jgi:four helix bundle protein
VGNAQVVQENKPNGFRGLDAWRKADQLASLTFRTLRSVPASERWPATQAARAAVSVPANVAEGYSRGSLGDYLRFLDMARGSLGELEYYIHFMAREGLLTAEQAADLERLRADTGRLLHGLWRSLRAKSKDTWDHGLAIRDTRDTYEALDD